MNRLRKIIIISLAALSLGLAATIDKQTVCASSRAARVSQRSFTVPKKFQGTWYDKAGTAIIGMKYGNYHSKLKIRKHSINNMKNLCFHYYRKINFSYSTDINTKITHCRLYKLNGHDALVTTNVSFINLYRRSDSLAKKYCKSDKQWLIKHKRYLYDSLNK